jgi:ribosomal protein S18 acetylase RimI-like enzyme
VSRVRRATPADASAVAGLLHDFNTEYDEFSPGVEVLTRNAAEMIEAREMLVLLGGEGPDGLAEVRFRRSVWTGKPAAYLEELYVAPAHRGHGLGREILRAVFDAAREEGATYIDLNTSEDDTAARALYESEGFDCHEGKGSGPLALYYELEL